MNPVNDGLPARSAQSTKGACVNSRVFFLLVALLLVAGCAFYTQEAEESETRTWPVAKVGAIDASVENGAFTVTAQACTSVTAVIARRCRGTVRQDAAIHLKEAIVSDSSSGGTLYLNQASPRPNYRNHAANINISAPAATAVEVDADNGAVTLVNIEGAANVTAANGAVVTTAHQGSLMVYAVNGAIRADISRITKQDAVSLHSLNGAVTLSLPADASVVFDARSGNGTVQIEGFSSVSYTQDESGYKAGSIGTGRAAVEVSSDNGPVTIRAR
jgi:hypothetical protein